MILKGLCDIGQMVLEGSDFNARCTDKDNLKVRVKTDQYSW